MKPDLSDVLCRLATGGGFATRGLYTDDEEAIFEAQRPVILTSIEEIGTRSDLLERSLNIELPPIREEDRRAEKQFWAEFEKLRPRILGALLCVVSAAIRRLPEIERKTEGLGLRTPESQASISHFDLVYGVLAPHRCLSLARPQSRRRLEETVPQ